MRLWIRWLVNLVLALVILSLLVLLVVPLYFQERAAVVLSSSMEPALPRGSLAFTMAIEPKEVKIGDIIAFSPEEGSEITTSHRVIEITTTDGQLSFRTKGDANEDADLWPVSADYIRGKVVFHIPYMGRITTYALLYVRTWPGLVFLIALPSLVLVGSAVRGMRRPPNRRQKRLNLLRNRQRRWKR